MMAHLDNSLSFFFIQGIEQQFSGTTNGTVIEQQFHRNELKAPLRVRVPRKRGPREALETFAEFRLLSRRN